MAQPIRSTKDKKDYAKKEPNRPTSHNNKRNEEINSMLNSINSDNNAVNFQNEFNRMYPVLWNQILNIVVDKPNYLNNIPQFLAYEIIKNLDTAGVLALAATCKQWNTWITNAPQKYKPVLVATYLKFAGGKVLKFKQKRNDVEHELVINYDDVFKYYKSIDVEEVIYDHSYDVEELMDKDGINKKFDFLIENEERIVKTTLHMNDIHHTEIDKDKLIKIVRMFPRLKLTELDKKLRYMFYGVALKCLNSVAITSVYDCNFNYSFFRQYATQIFEGKRPNFECVICNMGLGINGFAAMNQEILESCNIQFNIVTRPNNVHIELTNSQFYLEATEGKCKLTTIDNYPDAD